MAQSRLLLYTLGMPRGAKDHASEQAQAIAELIRREMGAQRISGRELARMIWLIPA